MTRANRFSPEVRERAVRMLHEQEPSYASRWSALTSVAGKIGCTPETLRKWVQRAEIDETEKKMTKVTLIIVFTILFFPLEKSLADTQKPEVKIRTEYKHSQDTPNHLVFGMLLRSIQSRASRDHALAVKIIQARFNLSATARAESILAEMLETADALENENSSIARDRLCGLNRPTQKEDLYTVMDGLDDARVISRKNFYDAFVGALNPPEREYLNEWLQERKKTYKYRTAEHKTLFESEKVDVVAHTDRFCDDARKSGSAY